MGKALQIFVDGDELLRQGLFVERSDTAGMNRHTDRQGSASRHRVTSQRCASRTEATLQQAKAL